MEFTKFALIQIGHSVFGVGDTAEAARNDAAQWVDEPCTLADVQQFRNFSALRTQTVVGDLAIVPCTAALADHIMEHGTTTWLEHDGGLSLPGEGN